MEEKDIDLCNQKFYRIYNDCCLTPTQQFSALLWREQVNDEVRFVLDQHA
jgi:hypothetical protein